jgi:hypothetical protein
MRSSAPVPVSYRLASPARRPGGSRVARLARLAMLTTLGLAPLSCAERITNLDPSLQPPLFPEGQPSTAQLMVWPETPVLVFRYREGADSPRGPNNQATPTNPPPPADTLLSVRQVYAVGPGVVRGMIFDDTPAERYQVFRREGPGFRELKDFAIRRGHPLLDSLVTRADLLEFIDPEPLPGERQYIGRGVIGEMVATNSPLTNLARTARDTVARTLLFLDWAYGRTNEDTTSVEGVSLAWEAVPGAVGYWLQVYQLGSQRGEAIKQSGAAAPLYTGRTQDYLVAYVPSAPVGGVESFDVVDPAPGTRVVVQKRMVLGPQYTVRISAIGAEGELIAYTGLSDYPFDWVVSPTEEETEFEVFVGGGVIIPEPPFPPRFMEPGAHRRRLVSAAGAWRGRAGTQR